jgi:hypothetical protein
VIAAVYEIHDQQFDPESAEAFIRPLRECVRKHPFLNVVVKDADTEKPAYEAVPELDLEDHVVILADDDAPLHTVEGELEAFEAVLPSMLDRPWPADIPLWRIVVLPLSSRASTEACAPHGVKRCFVAFAFSHTIGDGMVGPLFHRTFLDAIRQQPMADGSDFTPIVTTDPDLTLPEPFDTPERLPISWNFLLGPILAVYLPKFLNNLLGLRAASNTIDSGTWTGAPIFHVPTRTQGSNSKVKLFALSPAALQSILQAARNNGSKLTAVLHQSIVRALASTLPESDRSTNFVSCTAVDMRSSVGLSSDTWGLYVSGYYEVHARPLNVDGTLSTWPEQTWTDTRSLTLALAECAGRLHDQAIGLLRYAPSIRAWTLGKIGQKRDASYEVSNLLAVDGGSDSGGGCSVTKMVFAQPGNAGSAPLVFNVVSVKEGELVCAVTWQAGALGLQDEKSEAEFVAEICDRVRADLEADDQMS